MDKKGQGTWMPLLPLADKVILPHSLAQISNISNALLAEIDQEKDRHQLSQEQYVCVCSKVRAGDKTKGGQVMVDQTHLHDMGVVAKVIKVISDDERVHVILEGVSRVTIASAKASKNGLIMGFLNWPKAQPMEANIEEIQRLAQTLIQVNRDVSNRGTSSPLSSLVRTIWLTSQQHKLRAHDLDTVSKVQVWATQIADLLLGSPLFDQFTSRSGQVEALYAVSQKKRVNMATTVLEAISKSLGSVPYKSDRSNQKQRRILTLVPDKNSFSIVHKGNLQYNPSGNPDEWSELEERLKKALLPESKVYREAHDELSRLRRNTQPGAPSQPGDTMMRRWLECVADIPWRKEVEDDHYSLVRAGSILDSRHYGLKDVKERILEYLAVKQLSKERARDKGHKSRTSEILCLCGPPGIGKTSLAQSIADTLQRPLQRVSLGGVRDEAEIRGHRRTYIGAMPGRIIQALIRAGTNKVVILLDEIDKAGHPGSEVTVRGDPLGALLEVLDPEQNHAFVDHYVGHPVDLSNIFFIATANNLTYMPPALRDRMELTFLSAYAPDEKAFIGSVHLWPKQVRKHGLDEGVKLPSKLDYKVVQYIAERYTAEAGVRQLERCLAAICRHVAMKVALDKEDRAKTAESDLELMYYEDDCSDAGRTLDFDVNIELVEQVLGVPRLESVSQKELQERLKTPGVVAGLAWTSNGTGAIQLVECCSIKSPVSEKDVNHVGCLTLTGQLGDVLEESAQIALTWARSLGHPQLFSFDDEESQIYFYDNALHADVHIHLPAGSVRKDGPSAGVTIGVALVSLFSGRNCRADTAMTGELSLRGRVLPVGGIGAKVRAAQRSGITRVIVPQDNAQEARDSLKRKYKVKDSESAPVEIIPVQNIYQAIDAAIEGGSPFQQKKQSYLSEMSVTSKL